MRRLFLFIALLLPLSAFAQGVRFTSQVTQQGSVSVGGLTNQLNLNLSPAGANTVLGNCTGQSGTPAYCAITAAMLPPLPAPSLPATVVFTNANATFGAFTYDFSGTTLIKGRVGLGLTTSSNGEFGYDSAPGNWHFFASGVDNIGLTMPANSTPANNDCVKFTVVGSKITLSTAGAACGSGGGGSGGPVYTTVTFSSTPAYTVSGSGPNAWKITLTGDVNSSTLANAVAGQPLEWDICQDAVGGRKHIFPPTVLGAVPIWTAPNYCTRETFNFDGTNANFNGATLLSADNIWTLSQRFKGPDPWHDVTAYGASGSNATGTASGTLSSTTITLSAAGDFKNGQGIYLLGCNGNYATTIVSGGGTTTLIAADAAPCTFSGQTIYHDDQVAFQNAFNDAVADRGEVFCPPASPSNGGYNIMRAPLAVLGGQFLFQGSGQNSCKLLYPSQGAASLGIGFVVTPPASAYVTPLCAALLTGTGGSYCPGTGQANWFDVRHDCNSCGQVNGLANITVEIPFNLANLTTAQTLISSGGIRDSLNSAEAFELTVNTNGSLTCKLNVAGTLRSITGASSAIVASTTYHAALSYDGSNFRCFLAGTQVSGSPFAVTGTVTQQDYEMVDVGGLAIGGDFPEGAPSQLVASTGRLDAFRISSNARYTANFTPPTAKFGGSDANTLIQVNWDNTLTVFQGGTTGVFQLPVYLVQHKQCPASANFLMKDLTLGGSAYFATGGSDARAENVTFGGGSSGGLTVANCSFANRFTNVDFGGNRWAFASMSGLSRLTGLKNLIGNQTYAFILAPPAGNLDNLFLNATPGQKIGVLLKSAGSGGSNVTMNNFFIDAESAVTGYIANIMVDQVDSFIMNGGTSDTTAMGCTTNCWNVVVQETNHQTAAQFNATAFSQASSQDAIIHHVLNSNNLNPIVLNQTMRSQSGVRWTDQPGHAFWSQALANTITFSATPVFDCTKGGLQKLTLTGNVTSSTLIGCTPGQTLGIELTQDGTGGRTFVAPTNTVNFPAVASAANAQTLFLGVFDSINAIGPVAGGGGGGTPCTTTALSAQYNAAGAFGCISNFTWTAATGAHNFSQLANGNDLHRFSRFTDTSPIGFIQRLRNAANNADLYTLDVLGNTVANTGTFTGAGAGAVGLSQGTPQTTAGCPTGGTNCVLIQADTAVTPYMLTVPGVAAAGVLQGSLSGSGATLTNKLASVIPTSILELPIGTCTSATAATSAWDTPASGTAATVRCATDGSNVHSKPVFDYANSGTPEWWYTLLMPPNLTGNADMNLVWQTATVSGTATFNLDVICQNPNNTADTTAFSAGNFMAPAAQTASSTANNLNLVTVTNQAWPASCTSGTLAHFRLKRTDTGTAVTASVVTVQLTLRRTF